MKIFKLQKTGKPGYDENEAMIVVAENEAKARSIANKAAADEGRIWHLDGQFVNCSEVDVSTPGIVLISFNNG
jgi:hypothetical protein